MHAAARLQPDTPAAAGYELEAAALMAEIRGHMRAARTALATVGGDQVAAGELVHWGHRLADLEAVVERHAQVMRCVPHLIALGRAIAGADADPGVPQAAPRPLRAV